MADSGGSERATNLADVLRHSLGRRLRDRIAFLHVPKCGGSSIAPAIGRAYGLAGRLPGRIVHVRAALTTQLAAATGVPVHDYRRLLVLYAMGLERTRYVHGHVHYTDLAAAASRHPWSFVAVLREPVARWFSAYFYDRYKANEHARIHQDLDAFLGSDGARRFGDDYVRYLAPSEPGPGDVTDEDIAAAIATLERLDVAGVLEDMAAFRAAFAARFGTDLHIPRRNRSPAPEAMERARKDPGIRRIVAELCAPNLVVYEALAARLGRGPRPTGAVESARATTA